MSAKIAVVTGQITINDGGSFLLTAADGFNDRFWMADDGQTYWNVVHQASELEMVAIAVNNNQ